MRTSALAVLALTAALLPATAASTQTPRAISAEPTYRLINLASNGSAKAAPVEDLPITIDNNPGGSQEKWQIFPAESTYYIWNVGTERFASEDHEQVVCKGQAPTAWSLIRSEDGTFTIKLPSQDLVWTTAPYGPGLPPKVALKPATGAATQKWKFSPVN
ncbi:RICIN domain-containing protein [Nonomuraea sp. NPDC050022]|uniref:RICIN domain-containing protein n=1 Tax=Nonomuraea sp. NPDC050022 TaxID=3364358 RepID=UPI0037B013C6